MLDLDRERPLEPLGAADEPLEDELARTAGVTGVGVRERARGAPGALGGRLGRRAGLERPRREVLGLEAQLRELARHAVCGAAARAALGCERAGVRLRDRPAKLRLARGDPVQVLGEAPGALCERRLEAAGGGRHDPQGLVEPFGAGGDPREA